MSSTSEKCSTIVGMTSNAPVVAPPGLKGLIVADTSIGEVRGELGFFHYRHHDAPRLAASASFEDVVALVLFGHEPGGAESRALAESLADRRVEVGRRLEPLVSALVPHLGDPLAVLRAVLGGGFDRRPWLDLDRDSRIEVLLDAIAAAPVVVASAHRQLQGLPPLGGRCQPWPCRRLLADAGRRATFK